MKVTVIATVHALAAALLLAACTANTPPFPVPPALPTEVLPLPPVSEAPLIWQPGDWVYSGGSYRYEPGHYVPREGHGSVWLFGHWTGGNGQYAWVPGGWQ
jgi:hypothetical protein